MQGLPTGARDPVRPSAARGRHRLPPCPTTFFGRQRELAAIEELLAGGTRLCTLVGPGGAGKTRLAVEVAGRIDRGALLDGTEVCFCDLAAAREVRDLVASVADGLGVWLDRPLCQDDAGAQLGRALAARGATLLVLDNFEQLPEEAARAVAAWIGTAPEARVLVTSREALRVAGEACCEVGALEAGDAVALFEARARDCDALLRFGDDDRLVIGELSRRLDGLPLAIELAAAKVRVMSPRQLVSGLSSRFDILRSQRRDVDPRHATLECSIAWSWELLDEGQQIALAEWSVFDGGFDLAAAEGISSACTSGLELAESLAHRSLLRIETACDGRRRYYLYESVRQYAARELARRDPLGTTEQRHAAWFVSRAEQTQASPASGALDELARELDNLVAVVRRCRATRPELAARAVLALDPLLSLRGPFDFHRHLLDAAVEAASASGDTALEGRALCARGTAKMSGGDLGGAAKDLDRAARCARSDRALAARVLRVQARVAHIGGRRMQAATLYRRAVRAAALARDTRLEALSIGDRGDLYHRPEPLARALEMISATGDRLAEAQVRWTLGRLERDLDHHLEAVAHLRSALEACRELGARRLEGLTVGSLASALHFASRRDEARRTYRESIDLHAAMGNTMMRAWMLVQLGSLEHEAGRFAEAHAYLEQARRFAREAQSARGEALALAQLGALAASWDRLDEAKELSLAARRRLPRGDREAAGALRRLEGVLDLAAARAARSAGDLEACASLRRRAQRRIGVRRSAAGMELWVKLAARVLDAALGRDGAEPAMVFAPATASEQIEIGPEVRWFRLEAGECVDVGKRQPLRRILAHLLVRRDRAPSRAVAPAELVAAGWPGERMAPAAASNRLRNAIATLRRMGLKGALLTRNDGYMIDPDRAVCRVG